MFVLAGLDTLSASDKISKSLEFRTLFLFLILKGESDF